MEAWIHDWHVIHSASRRRGTMVVVVLNLMWRAHIYSYVLSTPVEMCSRGAIMGGEKVEVDYICFEVQVVDRQKSLGVIFCENVGFDGSYEC